MRTTDVHQLALPLAPESVPLDEPEPVRELTLDEQFALWVAANGHIFAAFREEAWAQRRDGRKRLGGKAIAELLRATSLKASGSEWRIDNKMISRMVRRLIEEEPSFAALFETRRLLSRGEPEEGGGL